MIALSTQITSSKRAVATQEWSEKDCLSAQLWVETRLYDENPRSVYDFYRDLPPLKSKDFTRKELADRLNLALTRAGKLTKYKDYLEQHGCGPF